jgi:hypothetical protein
VRDAKLLQTSQPENVRTAQMMSDFGKKTIVTPDAQEPRQGCKTPPQDKDAAMAVSNPTSDKTIADSESEKPSPLEQAMRIGQELYGFNHCKIQDDRKVFKYDMRSLDKLGVERDRVVPSHYIKHAELVLHENQTTYEKNWSYYMPLYEITEEMKQKLVENEVGMKPEVAQIIIDCWEKVSINEHRTGKEVLRKRFRQIHAKEVRQ